MLNEQASSSLDQPIWRREDYKSKKRHDPLQDIRPAVEEVMVIVRERSIDDDEQSIEMLLMNHQLLGVFEGSLNQDSEDAYNKLDDILKPKDQFALFRKNEDGNPNTPHEIHILQGRIKPTVGNPWINLALFLLTLGSVLFVGAGYGIAGLLESTATFPNELALGVWVNGLPIPRLAQLWRGLPYAGSIMLILGAHELGHYFAARYHKQGVSLPYFIPMPLSFLGTMGAVIRSREPMRNRKVLIDIGAAGPLAGLIFTIPILYIGLATSNIETIASSGMREGNSLLYAGMKILALGQFYPTASQDVVINQMALAGWLGLLVTALNLIPVGQLDGGHVLYSLFGNRARLAYYPVLLAMITLAILSPADIWFVWAILLFFLGRLYAPPLDDITPLDNRRRGIAIFTLAMFVLVFVPIPFSFYTIEGEPAPEANVYEAETQPTIFTVGR